MNSLSSDRLIYHLVLKCKKGLVEQILFIYLYLDIYFSNNKQKYFFPLSNSDLTTCSSCLSGKGNEKNLDEKAKQIIKVNFKK